ncbi:ribosomal protein S5 domain 2-type protein [Thamnidium elegans]|nr:ribosomal protein S5 domain 2-type protein [Thamnidium elegans]
MNKEQEQENRELQSEEMMALEAIFPESFERDTSSADAFIYTLNLDQDDNKLRSPRKLVIRFFLPPTYPNQDMPVYEISSIYCGTKKITNDMLDAIDTGFQSLFNPTEVVLFEWISWLTEYLEENIEKVTLNDIEQVTSKLEQSTIEEHEEEEYTENYDYENPKKEETLIEMDEHDRPTVRSLMGPNPYLNETPPEIFSSEPLLDRKSTFIAHVAKVHNIHQVKLVVAHLLQNKKIAKAAHNILAYRIMMPDEKVLQDNDDDGETAAGGRLLHLMQILEVENVVVVVSRWFGGIHLGPDRFKNINNVARNSLETCGFIHEKQAKNNKHNKKNKK